MTEGKCLQDKEAWLSASSFTSCRGEKKKGVRSHLDDTFFSFSFFYRYVMKSQIGLLIYLISVSGWLRLDIIICKAICRVPATLCRSHIAFLLWSLLSSLQSFMLFVLHKIVNYPHTGRDHQTCRLVNAGAAVAWPLLVREMLCLCIRQLLRGAERGVRSSVPSKVTLGSVRADSVKSKCLDKIEVKQTAKDTLEKWWSLCFSFFVSLLIQSIKSDDPCGCYSNEGLESLRKVTGSYCFVWCIKTNLLKTWPQTIYHCKQCNSSWSWPQW